jgi:hypothetical protein
MVNALSPGARKSLQERNIAPKAFMPLGMRPSLN